MVLSPKRVRGQAFVAPKDLRTKQIIEKNRSSSPLLSLPGELRNLIWGYVLGFQMVHVKEERPHQNLTSAHRRCYHTVCDSPVTEKEAYAYSRMEAYESIAKGLMEIVAKGDMRHCHHRHAVCYDALRNGPSRRLHIDLLSVCRQTYLEAIRILWGTNTWSIDDFQSFRGWFRRRNTLQRSLIKKVHLGSDIVVSLPPRSLVLKFGMLEELYVDVTTNCQPEPWRGWRMPQSRTTGAIGTDAFPGRPYFRAQKIFVICSGTGENAAPNRSDVVSYNNGTTTVRERIEKADMWCARLGEWGDAANLLVLEREKKKAIMRATRTEHRQQIEKCLKGQAGGSSE